MNNASICTLVCEAIDNACDRYSISLVGFVLMPEHVHLLIYPKNATPDIPRFLAAIKRPSSWRIKQHLMKTEDRILDQLIINKKEGKRSFRFWQHGPGFDQNLQSTESVENTLDYIHMNPARRGLVEKAVEWRWSSAAWYVGEGNITSEDLPGIDGLPVGLD